VGAAALLLRAGKPARVLHKHLGPESEHTVHEAELVGLLLGMHLISTEKQCNTTCMIGADNQAALKAFHSNLRSPGHHLAREVLRVAEQTRKRRSKNKYKLVFRWTAGHEGIEGNEEADKEAKRAAEGTDSEGKALPAYLRKLLPINPAAVKRTRHDALKKEWTESWRKSPRGRRMGRITEETPSKKFLGTISQSELSRKAASRIAQFRIGHAPVNQYLKRIGRVDSARCPACGADEETIEHYLLLCPSYAYERWALGMQARKQGKHLTLKTILGEQSMAIPLANYTDTTYRFKNEGDSGEGGSRRTSG
jgi:ribonuclease HI